MDSAGIKIRDSANEILARPAFPYARVKTEVELVLLSGSELGVETESSLSDVYKRAKQIGLELCPAEVGPQLRLHYRNQPLGEALYIAMEPTAAYGGDPTILALVNFGSGLELMGVNWRPSPWCFGHLVSSSLACGRHRSCTRERARICSDPILPVPATLDAALPAAAIRACSADR